MGIKVILSTFVILFLIGTTVESGGRPGRMSQTNLDFIKDNPRGSLHFKDLGDLMQIFVIRSIADQTKGVIRNFKVELTGDCVELVGVMRVPVVKDEEKSPNNDSSWVKIGCFLKARKNGKAVIRITPVGDDGKDLPTRKLNLTVGSGKLSDPD